MKSTMQKRWSSLQMEKNKAAPEQQCMYFKQLAAFLEV